MEEGQHMGDNITYISSWIWKKPSPSRSQAGSTLCREHFYMQHILVYRISQGTLSTQLQVTMTTVRHRRSQQCLQNWSLRCIGSLLCRSRLPFLIHWGAEEKTQHHSSTNPQVFNSIVSVSESLPWATSNGNPSSHFHSTCLALKSLLDSDVVLAGNTRSHVPQAALLLISSLNSCSKVCLNATCKKKSAWCEDLRGIVAFPLSESHSCATRPAAHAPLTPHAPVSINMLRDGSFTDTLPSSAPLKCNCVSTGWKEALI